MIQHFRFTLVLIILNIIAFGTLFFVSNNPYNSFQKSNRLNSHIIEYTNNLESLRIASDQLETDILLNKTGRSWMLEEPIAWPANDFAVNQIIHQLNLIKESLVFTIDEIQQTNQSLSDYGLAEPLLSLTLSYENKSLEIQIGSTPSLGNKLYLYLPKKGFIYVIDKTLMASSSFALEDLRQESVFNIPNFEIRAFNIQKKSNNPDSPETISVRIARNLDTNSWIFESPLKADADPVLVAQVTEELTDTSVLKFIATDVLDSALLGFENPYMKITLQGNKRRNTLLLGNSIQGVKNNKSYYAKLENNPTIFTVNASTFDRLLEAQKELREKRLSSIDTDRISTIDIYQKSNKTRIQKLENAQWQVLNLNENTNTKSIKADNQLIETLKYTLGTLHATDFFSDSPSPSDLNALGFNDPLMRISCFDKDQVLLDLAVVQHPSNAFQLLAKIENNPTIYSIEKALVTENFKTDSLFYKNKILEALPNAAVIKNLNITDLANEQVLLSINDIEESSTSDDLKELVQKLKTFRVKHYRIDSFESPTANTNWRYQIAYDISYPGDTGDKTEKRIYYFRPRESGNKQIGGSPKHKLTFENTLEFIEVFYRLTNPLPYSPESQNQAVETPKPIEKIPSEQ